MGHVGTPAAPDRPTARRTPNLLDRLSTTAVASDYRDEPQSQDAGATSRREQVLVAAVALALAGFVLALGVSSQVLNAPAVDTLRADLITRVQAADARNAELLDELSAARAEFSAAEAESVAATGAGSMVAQEVSDLELATGYTPVAGPGGEVTLTDAPAEEIGEDPELERVLDTDVQVAVNGLWAAGAEAVAVNGQRLTTQSAVRSAAGAILVNYRPLKPPYVVQAIGGPSLIPRFEATADAQELRALSEQFGIGFAVSSIDDVRLRPATIPLPQEAQVLGPGEGELE